MAMRTWDVEGAGPDVRVKATTRENAAKKVAKSQYGELGRVGVESADNETYDVRVNGILQPRRITVRETK